MADPTYEELLKRLEKTERNAQIARDWVEISNLHGRYNHLCLGHYWDKIVDELFAQKTPGVKVEIVESGVFHGLDGARKVFVDMLGKLYHYEGNCAIHELTTPIIQVQKDMNTAKGMWYHVGLQHLPRPGQRRHPHLAGDQVQPHLRERRRAVEVLGLSGPSAHPQLLREGLGGRAGHPGQRHPRGEAGGCSDSRDEPTSFHEPYPGRYGNHSGLPMPPEYVDLDSLDRMRNDHATLDRRRRDLSEWHRASALST